MNKSCLLLGAACMAFAFPAVAQQAPQPIPAVTVSHQLPVTTACPNVMTDLPERLSKAMWRIDTPADVIVKFTLNDDKISELYTKASYSEFRDPVRTAVRRLHCHTPDGQAYTVQFRIVFRYDDEDDNKGTTASIEPVDVPVLASR